MKKLSDSEALKLAAKYRIPLAKTFLAKNEKQAALFAKKARYPVALKVASVDIVHKVDSGGVILDVKDEAGLREGFQQILKSVRKKNPKAKIDGVLVQQLVQNGGTELIIGSKTDPQFGPVIMFGLGGIFVEVLKDVAFRIIPIVRRDAAEMIREIKGYALLNGYRGHEFQDQRRCHKVFAHRSGVGLGHQRAMLQQPLLVYPGQRHLHRDLDPEPAGSARLGGLGGFCPVDRQRRAVQFGHLYGQPCLRIHGCDEEPARARRRVGEPGILHLQCGYRRKCGHEPPSSRRQWPSTSPCGIGMRRGASSTGPKSATSWRCCSPRCN